MKQMSVKTSILIPAISVLVIGVLVMVMTVGTLSSSTTKGLTQSLVSAKVHEYANKFDALCLDSHGMVTALAPIIATFTTMENPREYTIDVLADILKANENMLGIWTCWEPNAFDGKDAAYANKPYHDATGRFVPYIYKDGAGYGVEALAGYDTPGDGDYYLGARNSGKSYITDPFEYTVAGKSILLYSIAVPIMRNGSVAGVVGIDIDLGDTVSAMNEGSILDDGYLFVISPQGLFATHPNSDLLLQNYNTTWMKNYASNVNSVLAGGGEFSIKTYSDQLFEDINFLASGIKIAGTDRYWAVCGIVPERNVTASSTMLLWLVIVIGLALIIVAGLTIFLIVRARLRELPVMTVLAETIAKGDINLTGLDNGTDQTNNEITLLGRAFASMANSIKAQASTMSRIAEGDYSISVPVRCDNDVMNQAINKMLDSFNETMGGISESTNQVSTGSSQVSDAAQMLARGATEQSATVEELSASVAEVAEQTKSNAAVAEKARALGDSIKHNAEQGAQQMEQMMLAVKDISDASQAIGKVIKIIDDIAFQTNILALNAAVEAARAGQHGKGFAVVADEVRNLAAKSAEAAKDTGGLIEASIQKSQMGASISEETAKSLDLIVAGIMQSSELIAEISKSSGEQSVAISQISDAIDQVSQVVQQNSATSEESAAASQEMSRQAVLLQQLIAQFKLKRSAGAHTIAPSLNDSNTGFAMKD